MQQDDSPSLTTAATPSSTSDSTVPQTTVSHHTHADTDTCINTHTHRYTDKHAHTHKLMFCHLLAVAHLQVMMERPYVCKVGKAVENMYFFPCTAVTAACNLMWSIYIYIYIYMEYIYILHEGIRWIQAVQQKMVRCKQPWKYTFSWTRKNLENFSRCFVEVTFVEC